MFSQGCHSGYNLVDVDGIPQVSDTLDWAQAFAQKGATLIAGTGYQYGDSDLVAYSEAIYANFSQQLLAGSGPVSVGDALVAAKKAYLAATPNLGSLDTKALLEASVFGLPMLSVDFQHGRVTVAGGGNNLGLNPVVGGTGPDLGLQGAALPISPITLTHHAKDLTGTDGADDQTAEWYSGPDGSATTPYVPVLPVISKDVTIPNQVLRGVGFMGGHYGDTPGIVPLSGAPATETKTPHQAFGSPTFYPIQLATPNYFDALGGGKTNLLITPAQYKSEGLTVPTSVQRLFTNLDLQLFYSNQTGAVASTSAPSILDTSAVIGHSIDFDVHVVGDPAVGIKKVWVAYTYGEGQWQSLFLTLDSADQTHWSGAIADSAIPSGKSAADLRYIVQAVNGVGLVSLDSNNGAFYQVQTSETAPILNTTHLSLDAIASPGTFGGTTTIGATLSGASSVDGQPIVLTLGGLTHVVTTDNAGHASSSFPLNQTPATYPVTAAFVADTDNAGSQASSSFEISKAHPTIHLSGPTSGSAGSGITATLLDDQGKPLGQRTVIFTVQGAGSASNALSRTAITDANGVATLGDVSLNAGLAVVTTDFGGKVTLIPSATQLDLRDAVYAEASDTLNAQVPAFSFSAIPNHAYGDAPFSVAGNVSSPDSTGAVHFAIEGASTGCSVTDAGQVTITAATSGAQACVITATLDPSGSFIGQGPISRSFTIAQATSAIVITCITTTPITYTGAALTPCTAKVTGPGLNQTLTVTYLNNTNAGTGTANASYPGDAGHAAATASKTFTIAKAPSTTVTTCPSSATYTGATLTPCTAQVTGAGGLNQAVSPVTYTNNTNVGTATANASFAGDANHLASTAMAKTFSITKGGSVTTITCPASVTYTGAALTPCTALATGPGLSQTLTVSYSSNTNAGTATANASYTGDANHTGSSSSKTFTIAKANQTITFGALPTKTYGDADFTLSATRHIWPHGHVQRAVGVGVHGVREDRSYRVRRELRDHRRPDWQHELQRRANGSADADDRQEVRDPRLHRQPLLVRRVRLERKCDPHGQGDAGIRRHGRPGQRPS